MHFRRAKTDSGGQIQIQEGHYGFRRENAEPSMDFRKANISEKLLEREYTSE